MTDSTAANGSTVDSVFRHPLVRALDRPIRRPRTSPMYMVMLAVVAGLMVLLPAIYVGVIALVGYGVYWHAVNDTGVFQEMGSGRAALFVYLTPLVVGIVLLGFMIKPLFAPRRVKYAPQALTRRAEPLIFAFVDKLCDTVGAPRPAAIHIDMDLNASAGFTGLVSGVVGGKLVLTVGLPLVAGLTVNQFTAILAHEFGHFGQRSAMRLSYVIRNINAWFARLVYERDGWDAALDQAVSRGGHWGIQLVALIARAMVWVSRRILWALMMAGHLFSAMLLRQMEYDADRYSARVIGSAGAQDLLRTLPVLQAAVQATHGELSRSLAETRLPDNVPQLIALRVREIPADVRTKLLQSVAGEKTGWFSSHPAPQERIGALAKLGDSGIFNVDSPAAVLLVNFASLSRLMTTEFYRWNLGQRAKEVEIVQVDAIEAQRKEQSQQAEALTKYLGGLANPLRPSFLPDEAAVGDGADLGEKLGAVRNAFAAAAPAAQAAAKQWDEADNELMKLTKLGAEVNVGIKSLDDVRSSLKIEGRAPLNDAIARAQSTRTMARRTIDEALALGMQRMRIALQLDPKAKSGAAGEMPGNTEESYDLAAERRGAAHDPRLDTWLAMRPVSSIMEELRQLYFQQQGLLQHASAHGRDAYYVEAVMALTRRQCGALERLRTNLRSMLYPYAPAHRPMTLVQYVCALPTRDQDVAGTMRAVEQALTLTYGLYMRLVGDIAEQCERIEGEWGLPALVPGELKGQAVAKG